MSEETEITFIDEGELRELREVDKVPLYRVEAMVTVDPGTAEVRIDEEATAEDYGAWLRWMAGMKQRFSLVLARGLSAGREKFGADVVQAQLELSGLSYADVKHACDIADGLPLFCWRPELSAEHHHVVSKSDLEDKDKEEWLKLASEKGLSVRELQKSMEQGRIILDDEIRKMRGENVFINTLQARVLSMMEMFESKDFAHPEKWPLDRLMEVRIQCRPIAAYLMDLNITYNTRRSAGEGREEV